MSGGMYFYRAGQSRPYRRGRGPSAPQFWGFRSIYAHTLWRRPTKCDVVTHMGRDLFFRGQPRPRPYGRCPSAPIFFGFLSEWRKNPKFWVRFRFGFFDEWNWKYVSMVFICHGEMNIMETCFQFHRWRTEPKRTRNLRLQNSNRKQT